MYWSALSSGADNWFYKQEQLSHKQVRVEELKEDG